MNKDHVERLKSFWSDWIAQRQEASEKLSRYLSLAEAQGDDRPAWLECQIQATDAYIIACTKCLTNLESEIGRWSREA